MKNMWLQASLALLGAGQVSAFWRMQCYSPLVIDRVDPIVQPDTVPSKHIHNIMGGSSKLTNVPDLNNILLTLS